MAIEITPAEVVEELQRLDPTKVQLALATVANKKLQQRVTELEGQLKEALKEALDKQILAERSAKESKMANLSSAPRLSPP